MALRSALAGYGAALIAFPAAAMAQTVPDRVDPTLVTRSLPPIASDEDRAREHVSERPPAPTPATKVTLAADGTFARRIEVRGGGSIPDPGFAEVTRPYLGRVLSQEDLQALAGAVAGAARQSGYVLATASIEPQALNDGVLTVTLDDGRVDAVRSIGVPSAAADRILATLVTHRAMTKRELEQALSRVADLPGVVVKNTQYMRQDGFGILLVTLDRTRATAYLELDNRGTSEIGPVRGVGVANLRNLLTANDEVGLVTALTPADPKEFVFVSGRYATPVGDRGGAVSLNAFYGHTHAGGSFSDLVLVGNSYGVGIGYSMSLERTRARSLWLDLDLHSAVIDQSARGYRFRDDHLTVASGTLRSAGLIVGGAFHLSAQLNVGLPVPGATREGDPLASRADGDARYVSGLFQADWARPVAGPLSVALASLAQVASRPLLATAEVSLGGPAFGRAYDYGERTGDDGVMGSAEVRLDLAKLLSIPSSRIQLYAYGDGGTVTNLRDGGGGGALASSGGGVRVHKGPIDSGIEVAVPLDGVRLETGTRAPRISAQVSVHF